ncbi:MAG: AAA family ATPase [Firmicutes bacterium]|nr:AAA family ATPase [Bacillota bacterium]
MKIAITGKGGVGKTTIAAGLARFLAKEGYKVIAIDADPDANLAAALGVDPELAMGITPIARMNELIAERTGAQPGTIGGYFKLNPRVDDIPDSLSIDVNGIKLLVLGTIEKGGSGCICPESTLLRALLKHVIVRRNEAVILDMEAGIEHLGRGTAESVDALLVVIEPGQRSVQTAKAIEKLAKDLSIKKVFLILNKLHSQDEEERLKTYLPELPIIGTVAERDTIRLADLDGRSPFDIDKSFVDDIARIKENLDQVLFEETAERIKS